MINWAVIGVVLVCAVVIGVIVLATWAAVELTLMDHIDD